MIGSRSHQPSRPSDNRDDYDRLFISRVHRLIKLGYERMNPSRCANDEETAITGDMAEAIVGLLDYPAAPWMRFYSVHDDPPEKQTKRRGRRQRKGRSRRRVDLRLDSSETSPRTRFRFECKRLAEGHGVSRYLGEDGLGCFVRSEYAGKDARAGMPGYVQSDDEETWADKIERRLITSAREYSIRAESPWRREPVIDELPHTYQSGHGRGPGRRAIEIYHTLLRFC